jgi:TM2 domain-containing membrane protein YozV
MKRSTKAVLLSALVFPGAGHFYLKRWALGILLSAAAAIALYLIVSVTWHTAMEIASQIQSGAVADDVATIAALTEQHLQANEGKTNLATLVLGTSWIIGIIGSYWQGRKAETTDEQL